MRLDRFDIESFGGLQRFRAEQLGGHALLVLLGDNEAGKSTFLEFLATMLYGFAPADRDAHPYAPWNGAPLAGQAGFTLADGARLHVTRRLRHAPEGALAVSGRSGGGTGGLAEDGMHAERDIGNAPLDGTGPVTRAHFESFHALRPSGLVNLDEHAWRAVEERLLGGAHLPALHTARQATAGLDARRAALAPRAARSHAASPRHREPPPAAARAPRRRGPPAPPGAAARAARGQGLAHRRHPGAAAGDALAPAAR